MLPMAQLLPFIQIFLHHQKKNLLKTTAATIDFSSPTIQFFRNSPGLQKGEDCLKAAGFENLHRLILAAADPTRPFTLPIYMGCKFHKMSGFPIGIPVL